MFKLSDVAKKAGVGVGTVSRVINNSGPVSDKTREKVLSVIDELNYVPNETARMFKTQDPKIVAILVPSIWHPFYSKFTFYVEAELNQCGYKAMICSSSGLPSKEIEYLNMLKQNKISGAICISYNDIEDYIDSKTNIVFIDRIFKKKIAYVTSNNYQGGLLAAERFVRSGYSCAAYLGTYNDKINTEIKYRQRGFQDGLRKHGIRYIPYLEPDPIRDVTAMIKYILSRKEADGYQGIFIENDMLALALYAEAAGYGIEIPKDLGIIGYDAASFSEFLRPALTTVIQPLEEMGRICVQLVMKRLQNESVQKRNVIDVALFEGETTL